MSNSDKKERYLRIVSENEWLLSELKAIEKEIEDRCAGAGRRYIDKAFAWRDKIITDNYSSWDYDPRIIYDEQFREAFIDGRANRMREANLRRETEEKEKVVYRTLTESFIKCSRDIREEFEASLLYAKLAFDDVHIFTITHSDREKLLKHAAFLERLGFRIRKDEDGLVVLVLNGFKAVIPKALWAAYKEKHPEIYAFVCKFDEDASTPTN